MSHEGGLAVSADQTGISLAPLLTGRPELLVANRTIEPLDPATGESTGQRIGDIAAELAVPVPVSGIPLQNLLKLLRRELRHLAQAGHTQLPLALTAVATIRLGDASHDLRLCSQPTATDTRLLLDREDVARLARS